MSNSGHKIILPGQTEKEKIDSSLNFLMMAYRFDPKYREQSVEEFMSFQTEDLRKLLHKHSSPEIIAYFEKRYADTIELMNRGETALRGDHLTLIHEAHEQGMELTDEMQEWIEDEKRKQDVIFDDAKISAERYLNGVKEFRKIGAEKFVDLIHKNIGLLKIAAYGTKDPSLIEHFEKRMAEFNREVAPKLKKITNPSFLRKLWNLWCTFNNE